MGCLMIRFVTIGVALALCAGPAWAQKKDPADDPAPAPAPSAAAPAPGFTMQVYGPGTISCATYLNDRSIRINADGWLLGFWTGSNRKSPATHSVGQSTDSRGIVGEVALACRGKPSTTLFDTAKLVYDRMAAENR